MALEPGILKTDHIQGKMDAPLTLLEFGDYECPYCAAAHPIIQTIQKELAESLRFVFRNFPLKESHPHAIGAALAAEAAAQQNDFWEMHDVLFENQDALELTDLEHYAEVLGLNVRKFDSDLENEISLAKVKSDFRSGVRSGVNGTPCFYINDEKYDGEYDVKSLMKALSIRLNQ